MPVLFCITTVCEIHNESINEKTVKMAINYDRGIQLPLTTNQSFSNNEMEGKRVKSIN